VKLTTENLDQTIANLESTWRQFFPDLPFEYYFLDDDFARLYRTEEAWGQAIGFFSSLSIFIACLGLLGLSAFTIQLRTKEVGVRKILGASVVNLTSLLSKDFVQLVLVANLIAWPLAWLASKQWLQNFAYQSEISWWVFALAGGLALFIAVLTVSTQAIRVALANPVDSLRCE
jgi:putative ABC transport system permease protein